ncbi:MAG: LysR family transcriptional regulator [Microbacteriaceae bacterium]
MASGGTDLNLLVALRALLEEANVTRAGQRINVGQSSMSSALSRLRTQFGDELLVRVGRDYELTPLARLLLPQVQLTLPLIEKALGSEGDFDPSTSHETFTFMMSDFAGLEVKDAIARVTAQAPEIHIDVQPLPVNPSDSVRDLISNDFAITVPGNGVEGEGAELFVDHYVCLVDQNNSALVDGALSWEAFMSLPQAVVDFGKAHFTPAYRRLRELGFDRPAHLTAASFIPLPAAIAGTELVAVVPSRLVARFGPLTGTIGVPTPFGEVELIEKLWWHSTHNSNPAHVWFRERLIEEVRAEQGAQVSGRK